MPASTYWIDPDRFLRILRYRVIEIFALVSVSFTIYLIGLRKARVRQVFMDSLYEPLVEGLLTFFPWTSPDHMQKYYVPTQTEIELEKTIGEKCASVFHFYQPVHCKGRWFQSI